MSQADNPEDEVLSNAGLPPALTGLRVLEVGHFVAAPFCARLLADLGADVIKIEPPQGDPARKWGAQSEGRSLWWSVHGRNKRSVSINLKSASGRAVLLRLAAQCDVLVENFRPGHLDGLGLDEAALRAANPELIIARISGFGQTGPDRNKPAFGVIGEAIGGLRHLTNHPPGVTDLPPVRVGVSVGDSLAGLYSAFGIMAALWGRERDSARRSPQTLDVALTESVLSLMEGMLPEYGALGLVKQPTGGAIATAAPSNAYPSSDGEWILIAANSEPLFRKLAALIPGSDIADDTKFADNPSRVSHARELDAVISEWTSQKTAPELLAELTHAGIPHSRVYTAKDCAEDEQFRFRNMVRSIEDPNLGTVLHPGIVPHFADGPGTIRWAGPDIGQHTIEVMQELLGMTVDEIQILADEGAL